MSGPLFGCSAPTTGPLHTTAFNRAFRVLHLILDEHTRHYPNEKSSWGFTLTFRHI